MLEFKRPLSRYIGAFVQTETEIKSLLRMFYCFAFLSQCFWGLYVCNWL